MEEVKRYVRLNTAALQAFKNKQKIRNNFVRLNVYNKVFIGVANNVNITNASIAVEFEKDISSNNIKIRNINDQKILFFANEGSNRLAIQFYSSNKLHPYVSITLNGNKWKKTY